MQAEKLLPADFDANGCYSNELIDAINDFDARAVVEAAKTAN
jgi:hypothetical protein